MTSPLPALAKQTSEALLVRPPPSTRDVASLVDIYAQAEKRLRDVIRRRGATAFARARAKILLDRVERIMADLKAGNTRWLEQRISRSYRQAQRQAALAMGQPLPAFSRINRLQVEALAAAAARDSAEALASVVPHLGRVFHDMVQRVAAERAIDSAIAQGVVEGLGSRELTRRIVNVLVGGAKEQLQGQLSQQAYLRALEVAQGKYISLLCRDGKVRNYSLKWYAETVGLSARHQAAKEATLATVAAYGGDLVYVAFHQGACVICVPDLGKVFSVSGASTDFPKLTPGVGHRHPRCRCQLLPASATSMRRRGEYDRVAAYSQREGGVETIADYQEIMGAAA